MRRAGYFVCVETFPEILRRPYERINRERRELLRAAYERFPAIVDCSLTGRFHWDNPEGRTAVFDLYYLASAGYIEIVAEGRSFGIPPTPYAYILTKAGIDLLEKPGEIDRILPIAPTGSAGGDVMPPDPSMASEADIS
jgi:hypothetical protein